MKKASKPIRSAFNLAANDNLTVTGLRRALNPPHDDTEEILHDEPVKDPFRPLEKLDDPATTAWIARQNRRYDNHMRQAKQAEDDAAAFFRKAGTKGMLESMPTQVGKKYVVYRKEEKAARYSVFLKDTPDYGAPARLLLDPMKIDPSGKTNIVQIHFSPDAKIMAYRLSVSGSDKETLRFMDIETGKDTDLVYKNVRTAVNWDRDSSGFHYTLSDAKTKSTSVHYHKMGTRIEDDQVVYAPQARETSAHFFRLVKNAKDFPNGNYEWLSISNTERGKNALLVRPFGSDEEFREIFPHKEGTLNPMREVRGKIYARTNHGAPNEKVVSFDVNDPSPDKWKTIIPENEEDQLTSSIIWQDKIFATYLHDTGEVLKVFDLKGQYLHDVPIPPLSTFTLGQRMNDGTCLLTYNNFQESGNIYKYDANTNQLTLHKKSAVPIDLKDCIVERVHATSKDGTKVPMTVIRHPDTKLDGTAATLLYGYGGFNSALEPAFSASIAQWVRAGGIYVQANLRGGGEYGQKWYDGGRCENKQNVFDDFVACAEHLIKEKYTSGNRLAIEGGSNGGLLTLATMIQRPELFGAVISSVPVTDMFRFHVGSYYGYSWKSDYGDPGIKRDFNIAAKYSPLHNVPKGFKHPPLLIKTDVHDDRVLPWHSFKMAATMQAKEDPSSLTLLKTRTDGGHSAGLTSAQYYADVASVRAFLTKTLGPINQKDYKSMLTAGKRAASKKPVKAPPKKVA